MTVSLPKQRNDEFRSPDGQEIESEFLARVRSRDGEALATFVRKYGGRMLAVARQFFSCEHDCADAVQDAFVSAFRSLDRFEGGSSLGTWLHRIQVNACLMKLRTRSRSRTVSITDLLPRFNEAGRHADPVQPWSDAPTSRLSREETRDQVRACIDRLPECYRAVLLLRDIEELDTEETAKRLGIAAGAVKTRLHRARQALRTLLDPIFAGE